MCGSRVVVAVPCRPFDGTRGSGPPGRPEEFHLQPPTEPCVNLSIYTARPPFPCHLAMTVDAESDRSSRLPGWRPPSLSSSASLHARYKRFVATTG